MSSRLLGKRLNSSARRKCVRYVSSLICLCIPQCRSPNGVSSALTFQRGKQSLGFQQPPGAMLGSFSSKDLSTSSKDTSLMFTSNLPSVSVVKETDKWRKTRKQMYEPKHKKPTHSNKEEKDFRNNVTKTLQTADREGRLETFLCLISQDKNKTHTHTCAHNYSH